MSFNLSVILFYQNHYLHSFTPQENCFSYCIKMNTIERYFREKVFCSRGMRTREPIFIRKLSFRFALGPLFKKPSTNIVKMGGLSFSQFSDVFINFSTTN